MGLVAVPKLFIEERRDTSQTCSHWFSFLCLSSDNLYKKQLNVGFCFIMLAFVNEPFKMECLLLIAILQMGRKSCYSD